MYDHTYLGLGILTWNFYVLRQPCYQCWWVWSTFKPRGSLYTLRLGFYCTFHSKCKLPSWGYTTLKYMVVYGKLTDLSEGSGDNDMLLSLCLGCINKGPNALESDSALIYSTPESRYETVVEHRIDPVWLCLQYRMGSFRQWTKCVICSCDKLHSFKMVNPAGHIDMAVAFVVVAFLYRKCRPMVQMMQPFQWVTGAKFHECHLTSLTH